VSGAVAAAAARQKFPPQITYIMASEGAERFSFYGMRNILVVYMVQYLAVSQADSKASYHYFVMANYLMPLVGGWLADRFLGRYRVILFLSIGYMLGNVVVATVPTRLGLLAGCTLIAIGAGGIKPCVSAFVGDQFAPAQKNLLQKVYGLFYWMVNLGSATASLLIPFLLRRYGPAVAFGVPGLLMALAVIIFVAGRSRYVNVPPTGPNPDSFVKVVASALARRRERPAGADWLSPAQAVHPAEAVDGARAVLRVSGVFVMVAGFWALFDQKGAAFILQAKQMNLDVGTLEFLGVQLGGFRLAESQMNAVNPFLVLMIVPLFQGVVYPGLVRMGVKVTPLGRMAVGMFLTMSSFVVMAGIQAVIDGGGKPHVFWQVIPILILTVGEVMISVTGLEFAFTQAPKTMKSTVMSFWLLTSAVGNFVAAVVSQWNHFQGAAYFLFFAALMLFCAVGFVVLARRYRPVASVVGA
jgi:POT family proton-dependent oligopeptide transporter